MRWWHCSCKTDAERVTEEETEKDFCCLFQFFFSRFSIKARLNGPVPASISSPVFSRPPVHHFAVDFPSFRRRHTEWKWRWGENKGNGDRVDSGLCGRLWLGPGAALHETQGKLNFGRQRGWRQWGEIRRNWNVWGRKLPARQWEIKT